MALTPEQKQAIKDAQEELRKQAQQKSTEQLSKEDTQLPWLTGNDS